MGPERGCLPPIEKNPTEVENVLLQNEAARLMKVVLFQCLNAETLQRGELESLLENWNNAAENRAGGEAFRWMNEFHGRHGALVVFVYSGNRIRFGFLEKKSNPS